MYIPEAVPDLVATLEAVCAPSGQVILAHGRNRGGESALMAKVRAWAVPWRHDDGHERRAFNR